MPEKMPDVIVLLPGITGSELKKGNQVIWGWSGRALVKNLLTLGGDYVRNLSIDQDSAVAEKLDDGVTATRLLPDLHMLPGIWKIDGYGAVANYIKSEFDVVEGENFHPFAYDWRRDNRSSAHTLMKRSRDWLRDWRKKSGNDKAKLILVGHSMGGLVSRYFLEVLEGWHDTRALITFGTPYRGSLNAVDGIVNGQHELGGLLDLSPLARQMKSLYQLLPTYECLDTGSGELRRVAEAGLPNGDPAMIKDAALFHEEIRLKVEEHERDEVYRQNRYHIYPIVGYKQPTNQSAKIRGARAEMLKTYNKVDMGGDGTVPRASAMPLEQQDAAQGMFAATRHAALQNADAVLTHLGGLLTGLYFPLGDFRAARPHFAQLSLELDDLYRSDEKVIVRARPSRPVAALGATFVDVESGHEVLRTAMSKEADGGYCIELPSPRAAAYRVIVEGEGQGIEPAADAFEIVQV
jgi:pimeloyl-ACP methyl ester carboxylesterase